MQLIPTFSRFWLCTSPDRVGRFIPSLHLVGWWPWNPKPMSNIVQSPEETWRNPPLGPLWHYVLDRTPPSDHLVSFGPSGQPNHSRSSRQFGAPGPFQSFFSQEPWPWHGLKVSSFWHGEILDINGRKISICTRITLLNHIYIYYMSYYYRLDLDIKRWTWWTEIAWWSWWGCSIDAVGHLGSQHGHRMIRTFETFWVRHRDSFSEVSLNPNVVE